MFRYFVQRLLVMIPTLIVISIAIFAIIQAPPGDFLTTYIEELRSQGQAVDQKKIDWLRTTYGLDQPFHIQYLKWAGGLVQGNLGYSFLHEEAVSVVVGDSLLLTIIVSGACIVFVWVVSFPIAIYSAVRQYSLGDYFFTFLGYIGLATPSFLIALILLYLADRYFDLSIGGLMDPQYNEQPWTWDKIQSVLSHLLIPVLVIGLPGTAGMIRRLRANLLDELNKQYVTTGRAKGLPPGRLLVKYPLRMALNPFIADIGNLLPALISGAAIVSVVMSLPTNGPMLLQALRSQDMYLAGSFLMIESCLIVIGVFVSDLALAALDPRIRLFGGATR